jgi:hypothetical protein
MLLKMRIQNLKKRKKLKSVETVGTQTHHLHHQLVQEDLAEHHHVQAQLVPRQLAQDLAVARQLAQEVLRHLPLRAHRAGQVEQQLQLHRLRAPDPPNLRREFENC